jgi:A/G-specific adenine glycosylase
MRLNTADIVAFHNDVTRHYYEAGRHDMPWRLPDENGVFDPYKILVSEIMLQQTQVERVTPKYMEFVTKFPSPRQLAAAELGDVLRLWNGLGYNRRAKYLWQAGHMVTTEYREVFPQSLAELIRLPGVGPNTAGAIMAYAYNQPVVFIETNIRTVIIHHFFKDRTAVSDKEIRAVLTELMIEDWDEDKRGMHANVLEPRQFYWAMMDYGAYLKKTLGNLNRVSKHYAKQSAFQGSLRQIRGRVIRILTEGPITEKALRDQIHDKRLGDVLDTLVHEDMIVRHGNRVKLS